jgi:hypothetical protein
MARVMFRKSVLQAFLLSSSPMRYALYRATAMGALISPRDSTP